MVVSESAVVTIESSDRPFSTSIVRFVPVREHVRVKTLAHESLEVRPVSIVFGFATIAATGTGKDGWPGARGGVDVDDFREVPEPAKSALTPLASACPRLPRVLGDFCGLV